MNRPWRHNWELKLMALALAFFLWLALRRADRVVWPPLGAPRTEAR